MSRTKRNPPPHMIFSEKPYEKTLDRKPWFKPTSSYKKVAKSARKAKENQVLKNALANNKDFDEMVIPEVPKEDREHYL